jgi:putative SOS response-associated peptidase YedK
MCARYTITTPPEIIAAAFGLLAVPNLDPRYNAAPSQVIPVVGLKPDGKTRGLALIKWGFVPRWAKDPESGPKPVNAKAETVATKAPFKDSFRDRRCLIPADGFYEWRVEGGKKVAHHFHLKDRGLFAFAGLWDAWPEEGRTRLRTCTIITVPPNDLVSQFHDRMPAILVPAQYDLWLDDKTPTGEALGALTSFPAEFLEEFRVGPAVNRVANDGPECLKPAG